MRAEIVSIGTELLLGDIVDTNAAWLAQQLAGAGVDVYFRTTVGDNAARIADVVRLALVLIAGYKMLAEEGGIQQRGQVGNTTAWRADYDHVVG